MRGVVGRFALRQGQGLDTKPSLNGDGKALLGTRGDEVEFVDLREEMGLFRLERKGIEKNTYMCVNFYQTYLFNPSYPTDLVYLKLL